MRWLFDANVWVAGFATRGLCADLMARAIELHEQEILSVLVCPAVERETLRILAHKIGLPEHELLRAAAVLERMSGIPDGRWTPPPGFPDPDDVPMVGAAVQADATALVTGDRALLELRGIGALALIDPREAFLRLRRLR